jgi:hypothetical protein
VGDTHDEDDETTVEDVAIVGNFHVGQYADFHCPHCGKDMGLRIHAHVSVLDAEISDSLAEDL